MATTRAALDSNGPLEGQPTITRKRALHARMSQYSLLYDGLYQDSSHTGEISTQVACNAACVQGKRSCKHEVEICVCASNQAWALVWVCAIINLLSSKQLLCVYNGRASGSRALDVCVRLCIAT